jgi:hypothetical protein
MSYKYKISTNYCWYNGESVIVKMYFIEGIPFTFDDIDENLLLDSDVISQANNNLKWDPEDLYQKSFYLIDEEIHPCLFPVELLNPELMPKEE